MKAGRCIDGGAKGAHKHGLVEWIGVSQQYIFVHAAGYLFVCLYVHINIYLHIHINKQT